MSDEKLYPVDWLPQRGPNPNARLRLFCLPHAGGGSAGYYRWAASFPAEVDVLPLLLPGRERRITEPAETELRKLVHRLADVLAPFAAEPFALFGHSMGGLTAFELCRELRRRSLPLPTHLFVAAYRAPQLPTRSSTLGHLPDVEFVKAIQDRFDGIPAEIARSEELLQLFLPTLRRDVAVIESYSYYPEPALDCPITALGGTDDPQVSVADLAAWRAQTNREFVQKMLPGGHFFVSERQAEVARIVRDRILKDLGVHPSGGSP